MKSLILIILVFLLASPAEAQSQRNPCFINTNNGCTPVGTNTPLPVAATITPSGTQDVNLTKILSAAPSLTNPLWVFPATGATFPVSGTFFQATQPVSVSSQYPNGATPITASATGTTGATTATLAASGTKTTYICGFSIRAVATAAIVGNATVTGTITGTLNFTQFTAAAASSIGITEPSIGSICISGSAINTAIAVVSAAPGTGGVISVSAWGYQL